MDSMGTTSDPPWHPLPAQESIAAADAVAELEAQIREETGTSK